jgi:Ca2+/Na+ antiporter
VLEKGCPYFGGHGRGRDGAEVLIDSVVKMMTALGASAEFSDLTIVAVGTSLPELAV